MDSVPWLKCCVSSALLRGNRYAVHTLDLPRGSPSVRYAGGHDCRADDGSGALPCLLFSGSANVRPGHPAGTCVGLPLSRTGGGERGCLFFVASVAALHRSHINGDVHAVLRSVRPGLSNHLGASMVEAAQTVPGQVAGGTGSSIVGLPTLVDVCWGAARSVCEHQNGQRG